MDNTLVRDEMWLLLEALDAGDHARARDIATGLLALAEPERDPAPPHPTGWAWPVFGIPPRITQAFNAPTSYGPHEGIDCDCYDERTASLCKIVACADGRVIETNRWDGTKGGIQAYGTWALIHHGDHNARYCHLSLLLVREGDAVTRGQILGVGGNSGNSRGAHLHLTVTHPDAPPVYVFRQRCVDPMELIDESEKPR